MGIIIFDYIRISKAALRLSEMGVFVFLNN